MKVVFVVSFILFTYTINPFHRSDYYERKHGSPAVSAAPIIPMVYKLQELLGDTLAQIVAIEQQLLEKTQASLMASTEIVPVIDLLMSKRKASLEIEALCAEEEGLWWQFAELDAMIAEVRTNRREFILKKGQSNPYDQWDPDMVYNTIAALLKVSDSVVHKLHSTLTDILVQLSAAEKKFNLAEVRNVTMGYIADLLVDRAVLRREIMFIQHRIEMRLKSIGSTVVASNTKVI